MTKENEEILIQLGDKIMDYLDTVCESEREREKYALHTAWNFIVCSCPYDKEEDTTAINPELLKNRIQILGGMVDEFCGKAVEEYEKNS